MGMVFKFSGYITLFSRPAHCGEVLSLYSSQSTPVVRYGALIPLQNDSVVFSLKFVNIFYYFFWSELRIISFVKPTLFEVDLNLKT